jgi:thioredoxin-like negative regulator of GroEL
MITQHFTERSFKDYLLMNPLVILIIGQKNCSPCHNLQKLLEQQLSSQDLFYCCLVDLEAHGFLKEALQIMSTPTTIVFYKGVVQRFRGKQGDITQFVGFIRELPQILKEIIQYYMVCDSNDQR